MAPPPPAPPTALEARERRVGRGSACQCQVASGRRNQPRLLIGASRSCYTEAGRPAASYLEFSWRVTTPSAGTAQHGIALNA